MRSKIAKRLLLASRGSSSCRFDALLSVSANVGSCRSCAVTMSVFKRLTILELRRFFAAGIAKRVCNLK